MLYRDINSVFVLILAACLPSDYGKFLIFESGNIGPTLPSTRRMLFCSIQLTGYGSTTVNSTFCAVDHDSMVNWPDDLKRSKQ